MIDLRSDTVTQPTPEMRQAMLAAPVGDDVLGDDPSVNELETYVAALLGKEAAIYMPSGTMTNQVALRSHTQPGDEIVLEAEAHIYYYEGGGPAALSGVSCRLLPGEGGVFSAAAVESSLRPVDPHFPLTRLVCIENTHNRSGGRIFPLETIREIAAVCRQNDLQLHMDGARFWNACVATGLSPKEYAAPFDTVSVCFSKGLGAPVGSALVGSAEKIAIARRFRKMFGGGMRQAGIVAAGALYAVQHQFERLAEDHSNAQRLAKKLQGMKGVLIDPDLVETNIVNFEVTEFSASEVVKTLAKEGVAVLATGPHKIRAVTNLMVSNEQIDRAADAIARSVR
ncbi:low specificity L-threonine aldolase [cf. Phormidesmis sp. LEGE 11477]|uniref:threonine aldolase family protein n=1 Tax=cf. Phormidesmis sp. LEGE 11477 TaxID=1828680 RepID=UPI001880AF00|nr:GntG family PLP-dependent aldolase [cf. Phormidesmis sp. LEGE 11477]MBE9061411.1 aminotransferase class I/II-fold pyridoxal phosphate-dependent enzyme [cf. Phormidesmis sp. LEGE 11477]